MSDLDPDRLTPGVLDGAAEYAFTYGACAALAMALHTETGWPIIAITDAHNVYDNHEAGGGSALHWGVQHPHGAFIDVDGAHDVDAVVERFHDDADDGRAAWGRSTPADLQEWYVENQGTPIPFELAATFVPLILAKAKKKETSVNTEDENIAEYKDLIARGLSDAEARGTVWPEES